MTRRKHGEGNYTTLPSGRIRWRVWVEVRDTLERRSGTADTEKQARAAVRKTLEAAEGGKLPTRSPVTLGEYAALWLERRDGLSMKTRDDYAGHIRRDIVPHIGTVKLRAVSAPMLRDYFAELRDVRELSYNTRRLVFAVLSQVLAQATTDGFLPGNPALVKGVRPVRERKSAGDLPAYTREEARRYLAACLDGRNRSGEVLALLLLTGLRKGEALYLRWEAVSLGGATPFLEVRGTRSQSGATVYENETGKTDRARRRIPLAVEAVSVLKGVRQRKATEDAALSVPSSPYVYSGLRNGEPYRPDNLDRVHAAIRERAGVRKLPIHALRHTYASLMAAQGMRIEVLSAHLGHADPAFTLRQYRHLYPEELAAVSMLLPPPVLED